MGRKIFSSEHIRKAAAVSIELAIDRMLAHEDQYSSRPLSEDYEAIGIFGEIEFACQFGLTIDRALRIDGDDGIDFRTKRGTVDVKTARKAINLIVEESKVYKCADILVLCQFNGFTRQAELIGWQYKDAIKNAQSKDFGYGVINKFITKENLNPMDALHEIMGDSLPSSASS
jgi:hypothetical protein